MAKKKSGGAVGKMLKGVTVLAIALIAVSFLTSQGANPLTSIQTFFQGEPAGTSEEALVEACVETFVGEFGTRVHKHSQKSRFQPTPTGRYVLIDIETGAGWRRMKCYLDRDDTIEHVLEVPFDERIIQ